MSDSLIYHACGIILCLFFCRWLFTACFYAGIEHGKQHSSPVINVMFTEDGSGFIFSELISKTFICQTADYDDAIDILAKVYPNKTVVISTLIEKHNDESI